MFPQQDEEDAQQNMNSPKKEDISLKQQVRLHLGDVDCVTPAAVKKR